MPRFDHNGRKKPQHQPPRKQNPLRNTQRDATTRPYQNITQEHMDPTVDQYLADPTTPAVVTTMEWLAQIAINPEYQKAA